MALLTEDFNQAEFVPLSVDCSNHGHIKLLPILVRYCKLQSACIETKLLDFVEMKGETSAEISEKILQRHSLEDKAVAFSADNTETNFRELNRAGSVNVHTRLKTPFNER